eukprot:Hpha_TRINITY_DN16263_c4_g2::TRINITY_DN16263_c4_g2_i2::g.15638::m.15638
MCRISAEGRARGVPASSGNHHSSPTKWRNWHRTKRTPPPSPPPAAAPPPPPSPPPGVSPNATPTVSPIVPPPGPTASPLPPGSPTKSPEVTGVVTASPSQAPEEVSPLQRYGPGVPEEMSPLAGYGPGEISTGTGGGSVVVPVALTGVLLLTVVFYLGYRWHRGRLSDQEIDLSSYRALERVVQKDLDRAGEKAPPSPRMRSGSPDAQDMKEMKPKGRQQSLSAASGKSGGEQGQDDDDDDEEEDEMGPGV